MTEILSLGASSRRLGVTQSGSVRKLTWATFPI